MYEERLQPHDTEAEESVIGSLLIDGNSLLKTIPILETKDFYHERNSFCYEACLALFNRREAINQVTLTHELNIRNRLDSIGGPAYLSHLISVVPTPLHIEHYARLVSRTATMRRLIQAASEIATIGYAGTSDDEDALSRAEHIVSSVRSGQTTRDFVSIRQVLDQFLEERSAITEPSPEETGAVNTGLDSLDSILGGLQPSDLIILAARPSVGKSTLATNIVLNAAKGGATVGILSLEMSKEQLARRMVSSEASIDAHRIRLGLYTESEHRHLIHTVGNLSDLPVYIDDTPLQGILEMRSKVRRLQMERGLHMVVVDYLQLIQGSGWGGNRVQEISEISRQLKSLARDLNIPILAVSQLSRAVEQRPSHRPQLSDLRDSGSIEQDADVVMFIYREDLYTTEEEWLQRHPNGGYPKNVAELIIAKHRHGPIGSLKLLFRDSLLRFEPAPLDMELAQQ